MSYVPGVIGELLKSISLEDLRLCWIPIPEVPVVPEPNIWGPLLENPHASSIDLRSPRNESFPTLLGDIAGLRQIEIGTDNRRAKGCGGTQP